MNNFSIQPQFNLLQNALNIDDDLSGLRYNKIVIATDADVDGMHIRLLLLTFFLQYYPSLVENQHVYILETPLFRVRNKKVTLYAYSDLEKQEALNKLDGKIEITRFKGLGEISPSEFKQFIGKEMKLNLVKVDTQISTSQTLEYYMGKNTPKRQEFIIDNLIVEDELEN